MTRLFSFRNRYNIYMERNRSHECPICWRLRNEPGMRVVLLHVQTVFVDFVRQKFRRNNRFPRGFNGYTSLWWRQHKVDITDSSFIIFSILLKYCAIFEGVISFQTENLDFMGVFLIVSPRTILRKLKKDF